MREDTPLENSGICYYTSELLSALANDSGLRQIIDIGYKMLGNPILIADKSWKAIAMTSEVQVPEDIGWNEFLTCANMTSASSRSPICATCWRK